MIYGFRGSSSWNCVTVSLWRQALSQWCHLAYLPHDNQETEEESGMDWIPVSSSRQYLQWPNLLSLGPTPERLHCLPTVLQAGDQVLKTEPIQPPASEHSLQLEYWLYPKEHLLCLQFYCCKGIPRLKQPIKFFLITQGLLRVSEGLVHVSWWGVW